MFGFGEKKKKLRGVQLIDSVVNRFTDIIGELEDGCQDCDVERSNICVTISDLNTRDSELNESSKKAKTMIDNLRTLLGA